jgi:N-acetylglucosamine repressor
MNGRNDNALAALHDRNRKQVFDAVRAHPGLSRTELSQEVGLSRATVSAIVTELVHAGLLEETGLGSSSGGRRPIALRCRPESRLVVGVVMVNDEIQAAVTDLDGRLLREFTVPVTGSSPQAMLSAMEQAAEHVLAGVERQRVLGVGAGTPGVVDLETGVLRIATSKHWLGEPIQVKAYLEARLGLPVHVANRSRVAALGELTAGTGRGCDSLIYLFLGQGIVAGIVEHGGLYVGSTSGAGEVGHVAICPDGPLCECGNHGCLEVYATEEAILARARSLAREYPESLLQQLVSGSLELLSIEQLLQAARAGDVAAHQVLEEVGGKVGLAVAHLINLFDPQMVVIGGPIGCRAGDLLLQPIINETRRRASARLFTHAEVVSGTMGLAAMAIGAAVFAITRTPAEAYFGAGATTRLERR